MPTFTIETTYRLPVFRQHSYEAETLEAACRLATEDDDWSNQKEDHETSGETYVTGAWAGDVLPYNTPCLKVPAHFGETVQRKAEMFDSLLELLQEPARPMGLSHHDFQRWLPRAQATIATAKIIAGGREFASCVDVEEIPEDDRNDTVDALTQAESFVAGFEDDATQERVADLLAGLRAAIHREQLRPVLLDALKDLHSAAIGFRDDAYRRQPRLRVDLSEGRSGSPWVGRWPAFRYAGPAAELQTKKIRSRAGRAQAATPPLGGDSLSAIARLPLSLLSTEGIMMRQVRPFIVEIKNKRAAAKQNRSIWGNIDLSAIAADAARESEKAQLPDRRLVDSNPKHHDADTGSKPQVEDPMADPQQIEASQALTEAPAKTEPAQPKKKKAARQKPATKAQPKRLAAKEAARAAISEPVSPAPAKAPRKIYSAKERAQKLSQIEKAIAGGASSKSAVSQVGISEQTYYHWKKAAAPAPESDALKDLVTLEEENKRLKKMLAEQLRKENAELKSRLGLA
jgi:hypothetical protein